MRRTFYAFILLARLAPTVLQADAAASLSPSAAPAVASPTAAAEAASTPDAYGDALLGSPVVVQARRKGLTAAKLNVPLLELPSSLVVVDRKVLAQQNANDWVSAMRNVAGAMPYRTYGGFTQSVMRGLARNDLLYLFDGVRDGATAAAGSSSPQANNSMENIDRVEVLKGPSALLYGQGAVAGVINNIRKKPSAREAYEFGVTSGSYEKWRVFAGAQGSVLGSPVDYRLDLGMDDYQGFRQARETRSLISLALSSPLWEGAEAELYSTYERDRYSLDVGIPIDTANGRLRYGSPLNKRYNTQNDFQTRENAQFLLELTQSLGRDWRLQSRSSYMPNEDVYLAAETLALQAYPSTTITRSYLYFNTLRYPWMQNLELSGELEALGKHQILLGGEHQHYLQHGLGFQGGFGVGLPAIPNIDLMNPVETAAQVGPINPNRRTVTTNSGLAFYAQDYWTVMPWAKVLIGGRYDDWKRAQYLQKLDQPNGTLAVIDTYSTTTAATAAPVYKAGLVFGPWAGTTVFISQSNSYFPNFKTDSADGRVSFDPETGTMLEGGLKFEDPGRGLGANLAFFDIMKHNIMDAPPAVGGLRTYRQAGTLRSLGLEADLSWEPSKRSNLSLGYAYTDASYYSFVLDPAAPAWDKTKNFSGNRPAFVPMHSVTAWLSAQTEGGFGVGAGGRHTSAVYTDNNNFAVMDGYTIVNAALFYAREEDRFQVNIDNVLDKQDYFVSSIRTYQLYPGDPRTVSVKYARYF